MTNASGTNRPTGLDSSPAPESAPAPEAATLRSSEPSALRRLSAADYETVVQQVAADLFLNDERYRKSIVLREVRKVLFGWGAAIGLTSLATVFGLFINARESLTQTVSTELSKAVKEHVSARTELLNDYLKSLTTTAVSQIVDVQKEIESAQTALDRSQRQLALANEQSSDLQKRIVTVSDTLKVVQDHAAWLGDNRNAERVAAFIRTLATEKSAKDVGDLLGRLHSIEGTVYKLDATQRSLLLDDSARKISDISRMYNNLNKDQQPSFGTRHAMDILRNSLKTEPNVVR